MRILIVIGLLLISVEASAQGAQSAKASETAKEVIPLEPYFAGLIGAHNRNQALPALNYWGVGAATWGSRPAVDAKGTNTCKIANQACVLTARHGAAGLDNISYHFAQNVKDRAARLAIFRAIQEAMVDSYGAPSTSVSPPEDVRGKDAFVQSVETRYELVWHGPQTNAKLLLTADELSIDFSPSPKGNAAPIEHHFRAFERIVKDLPETHPLRSVGKSLLP